MTFARLTAYLSFLAILAAHVVTGAFISTSSRIYRHFIDSFFGGKPLPALTDFVLPYAASYSPVFVGVLMGLLLTLPLYFIERSNKGRDYLPFWITVAWIPCLLHFATVSMAMALPFLMLNTGTKP